MSAKPRGMACPHCQHKARVRTSRVETPLVRVKYLQCTNIECGHTFTAREEITETIVPSAQPNPEIHLPLTRQSTTRDGIKSKDGGREGPPRCTDGGLSACPA